MKTHILVRGYLNADGTQWVKTKCGKNFRLERSKVVLSENADCKNCTTDRAYSAGESNLTFSEEEQNGSDIQRNGPSSRK